MTKELDDLFNKLENENPYDYFLIKKFHYNPKKNFNKTIDDIENKKYFNINIVYKYMFNNNFFKYLDIVLQDDNYINNLDYCVIESLCKFLKYSKQLIKVNLENDMTYIDIYRLIKSRINDRILYKDSKIKEKMKNCDRKLLKKVANYAKINSKVQYSLTIRPKQEKEEILKQIENDDYEYEVNAVLFKYAYNSEIIINSLYCENRFLNIIERKLLDIHLENYIIDNIIYILEESIKIKTKNYIYVKGYAGKYMLSEKMIKEFDLEKAAELIKLLKLKKTPKKEDNKVIYLYPYK